MVAYTEGTLDKSPKKELIGITLSLQSKVEQYTNVNNDALVEIRRFDEDFVKLESEINIVKKVKKILNKRVIDMERQCWASIQEGSVWKLEAFLVMFRTRTWNRKYSKSLVKLVVRSSLAILRYVIVSQTMIESLSKFCKEKIAIRSCQLRETYEK